jgi:serine/threonine protein kinase
VKPEETSLTDNLGAQFGPYKLVRRLGVGGMAETFVAVRTGPGGFVQRVCLKLVLPFFRDNPEFIELFQREARLAAKLRHRNIVGVIDFGEFDGTSYMALELVDGLDLRNIIDSQPDSKLSADYVVLLGLELAEALEHAHHPPPAAGIEPNEEQAQGIVHRDISPSNVLVSRQGEILLTDFGVAKAMSGASRKQSAVKGKVPYMPPEQLRAEPLDGRADLFALGVVLFEALGGERPYEGAHDPATIMLILKGEHVPLTSLAPDAPPGLCTVIESLIEPDPAKRPATASDLIDALDQYAPSPRVRRDFGQLVKELATQKDKERAQRTPSQPGGRTERLPDSDTGGTPSSPWPPPAEPGSGVEPSGAVRDVPQSNAPSLEHPSSPPSFGPAPSGAPPAAPIAPPSQSTGNEPSRPAAADVNLARPPSDPGASFGISPPAADLDTTLTTLREERSKKHRPSVEQRPSRRRLWVGLVLAFLSVGLAASAAVFFWPSASEEEASQQTPDPERQDSELASGKTPVGQPTEEKPVERPEPATTKETSVSTKADTAVEQPAQRPTVEEPRSRPKPEPPTTESVGKRSAESAAARKRPPARSRPAAPKPEPKAKEPGRLTITVFPWGNIWINGQPWGPGPLKGESVPPGTYRISVGQSSPTKTQTVRLKAGQRRTVHFDLSE